MRITLKTAGLVSRDPTITIPIEVQIDYRHETATAVYDGEPDVAYPSLAALAEAHGIEIESFEPLADEIQIWRARSEGADELIEADTEKEARRRAREWAREGVTGEITSTVWADCYLERLTVDSDGDLAWIDVDTLTVSIDPAEPKCTGAGHEWTAPHAIVGGCESNPGVWGDGGGVRWVELCSRCGCGRHGGNWGQRPDTGEQGLDWVRFEIGEFSAEIAKPRWRVEVKEDGQWSPGVRGALNGTGLDDDDASTWDDYDGAVEALDTCQLEAPGEYRITEV
jgi:hypothetical protein